MVTLHEVITFLVSMQISISSVQTHDVDRFFFSSRRRHTSSLCDWSSDVCSSDLFSLEGHGLFQPPTVPQDPATGQTPRAFITYLFASHVAQVLVDTETKTIKVERIVADRKSVV